MKVLVVGFGSIGKRHAKHADAIGHVVCVHDDAPFAPLNYLWTGSFEQAVLWGPEAVVVATPAATHVAVVERLRDCGYRGPLFVEKPLCVPGDDDLVLRNWPHPTTMAGYNLRWHPAVKRFVRIVSAQRIEFAHFTVCVDMTTWLGQKYADAVLECSHEIDFALHAFGRADVICAVPSSGDRARDEQSTTIVLRHDRGVVSTVHVYGRYGGYLRTALAVGRAGAWRTMIDADSKTWFASGPGLAASGSRFDHYETHRDELWEFLDAAARAAETRCSFADGLAVVDACSEALEACGVQVAYNLPEGPGR